MTESISCLSHKMRDIVQSPAGKPACSLLRCSCCILLLSFAFRIKQRQFYVSSGNLSILSLHNTLDRIFDIELSIWSNVFF